MSDKEVKLEYVGDGKYVIGVPTSAIVVSEQEAEALVATGLYAADKPAIKQALVVEKGDDK
jgi:hypothetical protein